MDKKQDPINYKLVELLNQTVKLEYALIIHYPRIASAIRDPEAKKLAQSLGTASIAHLDTVIDTLTKLGGTPRWSFESFPNELNLRKVFQIQLEKEKLALRLHQQIAGMTMDADLRDKFNELSREEGSHVKIVEEILSKLD